MSPTTGSQSPKRPCSPASPVATSATWCRAWEHHHPQIEADLAASKEPRRAFLVAHRGTRNQWIVTRGDLAAFLERRNAPAVRVGFDLTLTTEKSLGVLALLGDDAARRAVLDAIQNGNDAGLAYLEYHATGARERGEPILARGMTIASFRHLVGAGNPVVGV